MKKFLTYSKQNGLEMRRHIRRPKLTIRGIDQIYLCTRIVWDVTNSSARCCVTLWAVENLSALKGICKEFKITKNKISQGNKILFFLNKVKKICSPSLVSVVRLAYFIVFRGVLRCLSQLFIDEVKAGECSLESPVQRSRSLAEIGIRCMIFSSNAKKDSPPVSFSGRLGKIFLLSSPIRTIFVSLLELSTFRRSLFPSFRLRHIWKLTLVVLN